jgi:hypothetical protein
VLPPSSPWWWRQHVPLKHRSTNILHGSTSQKTILNFILSAVRTWNLTCIVWLIRSYNYVICLAIPDVIACILVQFSVSILLLLALQSFMDLGLLDDPRPDIPIKCFLPPCLYFSSLIALGRPRCIPVPSEAWVISGFLTITFYRVGLSAPRLTPNLEDQASVFVSPGGRVAQLYPQAPSTNFSRLLRHACATLGLFLSSGHHTGVASILSSSNPSRGQATLTEISHVFVSPSNRVLEWTLKNTPLHQTHYR